MINSRVIYSDISSPIFKEVINHMKVYYNCDPVFLIGNHKSKKWSKLNYPKTGFADVFELNFGRFNFNELNQKIPIDKNIIDKLASFQSSVMGRFNDSNGFNFSFKQRLDYYYDLLNYWNTVILKYKPNIYISYSWPHTNCEYILYLLCKNVFNIPVLFLDGYPHFENRYTVMDDYTNMSGPFKKEFYKKNLAVNKEVKDYLSNIRKKKFEEIPDRIKVTYEYKNNFLTKIKNFLVFVKILITFNFREKVYFDRKVNKKEWGDPKSQMNWIDYQIHKIKLYVGSFYLKKLYRKYVSKIDYKKKYFYFSAPFQPEAASSIPPGVYENLYYTLSFISNLVPDDTYLYYKEHPGIFSSTEKGILGRSKEFYSKLSRLKNIIFVDTDIDNFSLIDNSIANISISGTTPWLSLVRLKQTIILGNHWVSGCKGVHTVNSSEEFKEAINKIKNGHNVNIQDVDNYAQAIFNSTIPDLKIASGRTRFSFREIYTPDNFDDQNVKKISEAYKNYYEKNLKF